MHADRKEKSMSSRPERDPVHGELNRLQFDELTSAIIGCVYKVANSLGPGFLEKVYENALAHELRKNGFFVEQQRVIQVLYDGVVVGDYCADLVVENAVVLELKAIKALDEIHLAQCMNYLKATGFRVCLLVNFGCVNVQIKRVVNNF
jgi:GxxExxY protein